MALPIPCTPDDVTDQWLEQLLWDHHGNGYRLDAVTPVPMVANQVSYCSEMLSVECTGWLGDEQLTDHLLVKLLPREATIRALVTKLNMVQCETWVYRDLLPRLCRFEATRRRRAVAEMTASCLLADIEHSYDDDGDGGDDGSPRCVIVLENLQPSGFWTPEPLNLPQDALPEAVRQLARLAATSNAFLRSYDARKLYYLLPTRLPDDHPTAQLITVGVNNVEPGLRSLGREGLLEKLRKIEARATELISQGLQPREPDLRVVSHGDYRDGNLLLRRLNGDGNTSGEDEGAGADGDESAVPARWEVRVIDWQATMIAHPAVDLIYLLMLSLPRDAMRRLESTVLDIYWDEFSATCRALNSPCPLTRQTLAEDFRRAKLLGLMWCLCMVTLWGKQPLWPDQCIDVAIEVEELGLLEWL